MNFKKKSFVVALVAIAFALIFVAMMLDKLFSILLPVSMACIVLLVTFSICFLFDNWLMGFLSGVLFGLASFCKAFMFGEATFVTLKGCIFGKTGFLFMGVLIQVSSLIFCGLRAATLPFLHPFPLLLTIFLPLPSRQILAMK